jgi:hypothetical protein
MHATTAAKLGWVSWTPCLIRHLGAATCHQSIMVPWKLVCFVFQRMASTVTMQHPGG